MKKKQIGSLFLCILICSLSVFAGAETDTEIRIEKVQAATDEELQAALEVIEAEQLARMGTEIVLDRESLKMNRGGRETLKASVENLPESITAGEFVWSSSDENIARVDAKGNIQGVEVGNAEIQCSCRLSGGYELRAACRIEVYIPIQGISIKNRNLTITRGVASEIGYGITPEDATEKRVVFESSDPAIASVTEEGIVTGTAVGSCDVIVTAADGSGKNANVKVKVVQEVTGIITDSESVQVEAGKMLPLKAKVEPENAGNKGIEWSSADEDIASVDQNGRVMGKQKGETIISAKSMDGTGIEASFAVKVIQPVREIIADNTELALPENTTWKQSIKTVPENVSNDKIIWTSSDEKIAAVDSEGTITANKIGKCVITGTAEDGGGAKVSVKVTVQAFDYVIASPGQVNVEFDTEEYSSIEIGVGSRGAYRRKTERYTEFGTKGVVIRAGDHLISPVKAGDDVVTVITRINGKTKKKEKYTVFVDQSAIREE